MLTGVCYAIQISNLVATFLTKGLAVGNRHLIEDWAEYAVS